MTQDDRPEETRPDAPGSGPGETTDDDPGAPDAGPPGSGSERPDPSPAGEEPQPSPADGPAEGSAGADAQQTADGGASVDDVFQAALEEEPPAPGGEPGGGAPAGGGGTPADGSPATAAEPRTGSSLSALYDLTLPVSIELGRATMTVEEVLALDKGSVVELDRLAGEPVDIYVGDRHLAQGEVVVVREHFGVRITRLISPGAGAAELV